MTGCLRALFALTVLIGALLPFAAPNYAQQRG